MVSFWEVLDRAINTGPMLETKEFDMMIFKKTSELVKEYDIRYDASNPIPSDDSLADDLFEAGLRLYLETGTYCISSQRQIKFSESDIKDALKDVPSKILIGEGAETRWLERRQISDPKPPLVLGGVIESNPNEGDIFVKLYQSLAQEKIMDGLYFGPSPNIEGKNWRAGSPLEVHAGICAASWVREALRRTGRPGLFLISACPSAAADIASCVIGNGIRQSDAIAIPTTTELKTDYDSLAKVAFSIDYGCYRNPYWLPMIGGFAGGPAGSAIAGVAGAFHSLLVCQTKISGFNNAGALLMEPRGIQTDGRVIWVTSLMWQSLTRNTKMIGGMGITTAAGPGTELMFLETAATAIGIVVSGGHITHGIRKAVLVKPNQAGALEPKFQGEVAKASAGLKRADANEMIKKLLARYEDKLAKAPEGKSFEELHDLKTLAPREDYLALYNGMKIEMQELGLSL